MMQIDEKLGILGLILLFSAGAGLLLGWVKNVVKLFGFAVEGFSGNELEVGFRSAGVFVAPLGGILGWF